MVATAHGTGPVSEFCAALDQLRIASGSEVPLLARQLGLSRAQLYAILAGRIKRPPDWDRVVRPLVDACARGEPDVLAAWRRRHAILSEVWEELRRRDQLHVTDAKVSQPGTQATEPPRQLPADVGCFTGRSAELAALNSLLGPAPGKPSQALAISVIGGMAGVGKTTLAVHWAHQVAERFPDGQLYANLRGFDPSGTPIAAEAVVCDFLGALGVSPARIPPSADAQAALYRTVLATKRVLVVLDNAHDANQIRPMLPGSAGCFVLVTSRAGLVGLAAAEGARVLTLDVPDESEARELLSRRLGAELVAAEPEAADELIRLCASLPLALSIVAARAATSQRSSLAALAAELNDATGRLNVLEAGTAVGGVRTAFSCSYRWLSTAAARLFRLLGLHQGPDVSAAAAASLAGLARWEIRPVLRELADVSLIVEHLPGRFVMHDLLRAYAAEQSADSEGSAALGRLLDHYLRTGYAAARILYQHRETIPLPPGQPGVVPEELNGYDEALAWFEIERQGLEAAIATASATGFDLYAWQIAWTLVDFLHWRGYWHNIIITQNIALTSARRLRESAGEALVHRSLARAYCELGELGNAGVHLRQALELYRELKDPVGQGLVHMGLGLVLDREERYAEALDHARQSLKLHQEFNNQVGQADALNAISWCLVKLHKYEQAIHYSKQALALHELLANRIGAAHTWDTLGYACHHTGDYATAASCYRSALELFRAIGNEHYMAIALTHLGETYREANDVAAARAAWEQALSIVPGLDHAAATEIQVKLDNLVHASLRFFMIANG